MIDLELTLSEIRVILVLMPADSEGAILLTPFDDVIFVLHAARIREPNCQRCLVDGILLRKKFRWCHASLNGPRSSARGTDANVMTPWFRVESVADCRVEFRFREIASVRRGRRTRSGPWFLDSPLLRPLVGPIFDVRVDFMEVIIKAKRVLEELQLVGDIIPFAE
jgi:hypothetical protein